MTQTASANGSKSVGNPEFAKIAPTGGGFWDVDRLRDDYAYQGSYWPSYRVES